VRELIHADVGLGDDTGAFRLYERAGMAPVLGWVMYEKELGDAIGLTHAFTRRPPAA
jgi:hypothetical protein